MQRAVVLEHLGEAQLHLRPSLALHLEADPADHVLAEVEDVGPRAALGDRHGLQLLRHAHGLGALGDERDAVVRRRRHRGPGAELAPGVVALAHQEVRVLDRPGRRAPLRVAGDDLDGAVLVLEVELAQQCRIAAVVVAAPQRVEADEAGVPPRAEDRAEHVLAVADELGDVVRRVLDPLPVVRPARREDGCRRRARRSAPARPRRARSRRASLGAARRLSVNGRRRYGQVEQRAQEPVRVVPAARRGHRPGRGSGRGRSTAPSSPRGRCGTARARSSPTPRRPRPRPGPTTRTRHPAAAAGPRRRRRPSPATRPCRCPTACPRPRPRGSGRRSGACRARRTRAPSSAAAPARRCTGTSSRCSQRRWIARMLIPSARSRSP